jgi:hypothetical protein
MTHTITNSPFYILSEGTSGHWKGWQMISVNREYEGDLEQLTLQDLLTFLEVHDVSPANVKITNVFRAFIKGN